MTPRFGGLEIIFSSPQATSRRGAAGPGDPSFRRAGPLHSFFLGHLATVPMTPCLRILYALGAYPVIASAEPSCNIARYDGVGEPMAPHFRVPPTDRFEYNTSEKAGTLTSVYPTS